MFDDKIPSNFYSAPGPGSDEFTHTSMTTVSLPPPPPDWDDDGVMDFEPAPLDMDPVSDVVGGFYNDGTSRPGNTTIAVMAPVPPKPKNYKALAKTKIVETMSAYGSPRRVALALSMVDSDTGSGKAVVTIGRDIKQRKFEVPVSIKSGEVSIGRARDIVSNQHVDLNSEDVFAAPDEDVMRKELDETYDKYSSFFKGRVTDKKTDALVKRYPSLTEAEARQYLEVRYESGKGMIGHAIDLAKEHRRKILIVGGATAFFGVLYVRNKLKNRTTG